MKQVLFVLILISLTLAGCKTQKDPAKAAAKEREQKIWFDKAVQALNDREFVLEADRITFKYGHFTYVNANTNFVSMHGDKATIQMAFNSPYAGPNGIGGITVDGTASNVKMVTDKKGNITFTMGVIGVGVSATVTIQMINGTNQCSATINPNFNSNRITFTGKLYQEADSDIFKGRAL
ncbi:DUF4251 domain-containing protein [Dysgonomonas sp. Marseille-P4677]|uniref:DUF4251 domain-containing protein n=1 Tax=Dysgonomonas sp. Marseille-P4677 TaxID=2364790 RepID=UPI001913E3F8|nr:DUF4251 domain-containing protein [Dysgonomonas sp. Marseille-P4677]MBK5721004.1 DUF4251 domain-containing protein [Dysgonomonas sp. Marseille-P4677]